MSPKHPKASGFLRSNLFDGLKHFRDLEARITALPTSAERGAAFEVFVEAYLATQRTGQAKEIWPEGTIPSAASKQLNLGVRQGVGVDGVYSDHGGAYYAYQVKFRAGRPALPYNDVAPFFGITEKFAQRVLITNSDDLASQINERSNFFCIRGYDFDRLEPDDFAAIRSWLAGSPPEIHRKSPHDHQYEALEAILPVLQVGDRATAVMACGTGKTLVALWVAESLGAKQILVLVPSLALIRQTLHEWLRETSWTELSFLCVCSDPTVTKGADQIQVHLTDLDFPVTTDGAVVSSFLAGAGTRIVFSTYQSARVVAQGMRGRGAFDLGIFDEAHKTAGPESKRNAFALNSAKLQIRKRLFMTATPRHASTRKRTADGEQALLYSMDKPATYGPIVYTLGFAEAAKRRIISDYKLVVSVVTSMSLNDELLSRGLVTVQDDPVRARQVANQLALERAVREYGVTHIFSFHGNVASAKSFTSDDPEGIGSIIPKMLSRHVNGEMRTADREAAIDEFRRAPLGIVSNARCLTEGVDLPAVDMVAFMSPKRSKVDIVQATGRAMRIPSDNPGKRVGYIFLPLYIEQGIGETAEEALKRTRMDELVDVLNAMKEQDVVLANLLQAAQEDRGKIGGFDDSVFRERLDFLGPVIPLDALRAGITTKILETAGAVWDLRYGQLMAYKSTYGDCNVPKRWKGNPKLGVWCGSQRQLYGRNGLPADRIRRLEALGFVWDTLAADWEDSFAALTSYRQAQGDCNVPKRWNENRKLGLWCASQRVAYRCGRISVDRIRRLESLGFTWEPLDAIWEEMLAELRTYRQVHRHSNVPVKSQENPKLARWLHSQKNFFREGRLPPDRIKRLEELGVVWDLFAVAWEEMFAALVAYKTMYRDCDVPSRWAENPKLASWCNTQRVAYRRAQLPPERLRRLVGLGFKWHLIDAAWEEKWAALSAYKQIYGHSNVPDAWRENPTLGKWCTRQRKAYKIKALSPDYIERLRGLGFAFDLVDAAWEEKFAALTDYKKVHGHCNVPDNAQGYSRLSGWCGKQRKSYKARKLSPVHIKRLEDLGFTWDPLATAWDAMYMALTVYKETHGDCNVAQAFAENPELGRWCTRQRTALKAAKLSDDRIAKLQGISFSWDTRESDWEEMFSRLSAYRRANGNCNVPDRLPDDPELASWIKVQRKNFKTGALSVERARRLEKLGFVWNVFGEVWDEMFARLTAYAEEHGHCNVPAYWSGDRQLARWCTRQRSDYKNRRLSADRISRLEAMEFRLRVREAKRQ